MKNKIHYSAKQKANLIERNVGGCPRVEAEQIANVLEGFSFAMLREFRSVVHIMAQGQDKSMACIRRKDG